MNIVVNNISILNYGKNFEGEKICFLLLIILMVYKMLIYNSI